MSLSSTLDMAIAWRLRLETAAARDLQVQDDFEQWLATHESHARIWRQLDELDARFGAVDAPARAVLLRAPRPAPAMRRAGLGLLLACVLLLPLADRQWPLRELLADRFTATGEVRELTLPDHSRLVMDTRSAIDLDFGGDTRRVILRRGAILIETAHGDTRPFVVQTDDGELRPLGTRFTVRRDEQGTLLTVLAASVTATPRDGLERRVDAGERFRLRAGEQVQPAPVGADAWTHGMLAADNARLADVIAELGRYHRGHLAVDPAVAELRVTGSFPLHDPDLAIAALAQTLPITPQRRSRWWITVVVRE